MLGKPKMINIWMRENKMIEHIPVPFVAVYSLEREIVICKKINEIIDYLNDLEERFESAREVLDKYESSRDLLYNKGD